MLQHMDREMNDRFRTLTWDIGAEFWRMQGTMHRRPWSSIVMDPRTERVLVDSLSDFFAKDTQQWYKSCRS